MRNDNLKHSLLLARYLPNNIYQTRMLHICLMPRNVNFLLVKVIFPMLYIFYDSHVVFIKDFKPNLFFLNIKPLYKQQPLMTPYTH